MVRRRVSASAVQYSASKFWGFDCCRALSGTNRLLWLRRESGACSAAVLSCLVLSCVPILKEKERICKFTANHLSETETSEVIQPEVIKAICERHDIYFGGEGSESSDHSVALVESIALGPEALPPCFQGNDSHGLPVIPSFSFAEISEKQQADASIREIITQLESGETPPPQVRKELPEYGLLLREWNRLELKNGVLFRKRQGVMGVAHQLVLPRELRDMVLESLHDDMGHLGVERTVDLYVQGLKNHLKESYELSSRNAKKSAERNKTRFDQRVTGSSLEPGDRVLVRNVRLRGKHKLADKWEADVYVVVSHANDLPVYTVCPEAGNGPLRTLHRDLLLPCGFLPISAPETPAPPTVQRPRTRQNPGYVNECFDDVMSDDEEVYPSRVVLLDPAASTTMPEVDRMSSNIPPEQHVTDSVIPLSRAVVPGAVSDEIEVEIPIEAGEEPPATSSSQVSFLDLEEPGRTGGDESESSGKDSEISVPLISPVGESQLLDIEGTQDVPETDDIANLTHIKEPSEGLDEAVRYSNRQRSRPKRFHYAELGNPLIEVVQSLFHGLGAAIIRSMDAAEPLWYDQTTIPPVDPVTTQPQRRCTGTCHPSVGEGVTLESY
ncbi:unnamed protein product [Oreochromis niloticus]|nr:unnamed protein product [Mustela putorius furo]